MFDQRHRSGDLRADRRAEYAEQYARTGDIQAAIDLMNQALELAPHWPLGRLRLAEFLEAAGQNEQAILHYHGLLSDDQDDRYGARLKLAALGCAPVPESPSPAFVAGLFDQYAEKFEASLVERLGYSVPEQLAAMLGLDEQTRLGDVLDLGCGTGLMGEQLSLHAAHLYGLDLSEGMLAKARQKHIYDALYCGDICVPPELVCGRAYDLITAADVLIYLGDLAPVLSTVRLLLSPGGRFAFSTESDRVGETYSLMPSLRYAHAPAYVETMLAQHGFTLHATQHQIIRRDRGMDVHGTLYLCS